MVILLIIIGIIVIILGILKQGGIIPEGFANHPIGFPGYIVAAIGVLVVVLGIILG